MKPLRSVVCPNCNKNAVVETYFGRIYCEYCAHLPMRAPEAIAYQKRWEEKEHLEIEEKIKADPSYKPVPTLAVLDNQKRGGQKNSWWGFGLIAFWIILILLLLHII